MLLFLTAKQPPDDGHNLSIAELCIVTCMCCMQIMVAITEKQRRPEIPAEADMRGGTFAGLPGYVQLMEDCWQDDADQRPTFELVIVTLRGLLEQAMTNRYIAVDAADLVCWFEAQSWGKH